jgi:cytosine/adenosine deaminase-related metal-dependent hydrolase
MLRQLSERQPGMPAIRFRRRPLTVARTLELNDDLGLLAVGYLADLTVVDAR